MLKVKPLLDLLADTGEEPTAKVFLFVLFALARVCKAMHVSALPQFQRAGLGWLLGTDPNT